jgi:hypothetical protein
MSDKRDEHSEKYTLKWIAERYRQHRKTVNENLGLIVGLLASAAAIWTRYEARHARLEAQDAAHKSLLVQQDSVTAQIKSVDAQIAAMRFEQRPYVRVVPVGIMPTGSLGRSDYVGPNGDVGTFKLTVFGRTPATLLSWRIECGPAQANQIGSGQSLSGPVAVEESQMAVANDSDSAKVYCPFTEKLYHSATDEGIRHGLSSPDTFMVITFVVDVTYQDVFLDKHRTKECFYVWPFLKSPIAEKLISCGKFTPIIE